MIKNRPTFPKGKLFLSSGSVEFVNYCSDGFEIYQLTSLTNKSIFGVIIHCENETEADKISEKHQNWWRLLQNITLLEKSKTPFRDHILFSASVQVNDKVQRVSNSENFLLNQNQALSLLEDLIRLCKIATENNLIPILDEGSFVPTNVGDSFIIFPLFVANRFDQKNHEYLCSIKSIVKVVYQFATGIKIEGTLSELKSKDIAPAHRWNPEIHENLSNFLKSVLLNKKNIDSSLETFENDLKLIFDQNSSPEMISDLIASSETDDSSLSIPRGLKKIAGMKKLKELLLEEVIRPLRNPEPYKIYKIGIPNGILLFGPPGCGKTFIARQLAEELNYYFLEISPSEIASPFIHHSVLKIRGIFDDAEQHAPSIIFIDEFEAFVPSRSSLGGHQQFKSEEVNEFLHHLNECSDKGIIILAATNEPEKIDNAILRTGRFDKLIYVEPPDLEARIDLLKMYLKNRPQDPINFEAIALLIEGYSCSDVKNILDESARAAMKQGIPINQAQIIASIERNPSSLSNEIISKYEYLKQRGIEQISKHENNILDRSSVNDSNNYIW
jgi:SpoVK/Ycf46/Vps4 family AAA+-type ATPase